jgi:hypothetical protein
MSCPRSEVLIRPLGNLLEQPTSEAFSERGAAVSGAVEKALERKKLSRCRIMLDKDTRSPEDKANVSATGTSLKSSHATARAIAQRSPPSEQGSDGRGQTDHANPP